MSSLLFGTSELWSRLEEEIFWRSLDCPPITPLILVGRGKPSDSALLNLGVRDQVDSLKVKIGIRDNRLSLRFPNSDSYISEDIGMMINALFQVGSFQIVWWLPRTPHRCWPCSPLWWYQYSLSRSQAVGNKPKSVGTASRSWLLSSPSSPPGSSQVSSSTSPLNVSSKESLSLTWTWCWPLRLLVLWQIWCKKFISLSVKFNWLEFCVKEFGSVLSSRGLKCCPIIKLSKVMAKFDRVSPLRLYCAECHRLDFIWHKI